MPGYWAQARSWKAVYACAQELSSVWLCSPMNMARQAPLSMRILQTRIVERVAISSSRGSSPPRDGTCVSCSSCIGRWVLYGWSPTPGWSWSSSILVVWCKQSTHWKSPWCWERLRAEPTRFLCPWNSPGKNIGVGSQSLLRGIKPWFPALKADSLLSEPPGKPQNGWRVLVLFLYLSSPGLCFPFAFTLPHLGFWWYEGQCKHILNHLKD